MSNLEESVILGTAQKQSENRTQRATRIVLDILTETKTSLSGEKVWKQFQQRTEKSPAFLKTFKYADEGHRNRFEMNSALCYVISPLTAKNAWYHFHQLSFE